MHFHSRYLLSLVMSCLAAAGCSDREADRWKSQRPAVVPVSGTVLYQGQPVEGASVNFMNPETETTAYALTDAQGRFVLTTFEEGDGATPGKQQVSVGKVEVIDRSVPGVDYSTTAEDAPLPEQRWLVPERFSQFATSGLTVEVTAQGANDHTLKLD